jgi:hypothetical protein
VTLLADTPRTWPDPVSISTLKVLAIFAGIPLLVIIIVSLLVLAPGWVKGPRYRPGLPWEADNVWFGVGVGARPEAATDAATVDAGRPAGPAETAASADTADAGPPGPSAPSGATRAAHPDQRPGGASAGW